MAQITLNSSGVASSGSLLLQTNGTTTQATVDTSGNLGLGVTPSNAYTSAKSFEGTSGQLSFNGSAVLNLTQNAYYNAAGAFLYKNTAAATLFQQTGGAYYWYNAASGTAGNAITFTQAMTLDASGNLLVGGTTAVLGTSGRGVIEVNGSSTAIIGLNTGGAAAGYLFQNGVNMDLHNTKAGYLSFSTNDTERARIDSSGNLLVGKTTAADTTVGAVMQPTGRLAGAMSASTDAQDTLTVYSTGAGAYRFYVGMSGKIYATSTTISAISDERLKENIKDIDTGLNAVLALKPRRFDWKEGKGQDKKNAAGFIAQEFETVFPDSVGTSKAGADGIEYKNICHEELIPTLVKAIQEQQAIITALTARIETLEQA